MIYHEVSKWTSFLHDMKNYHKTNGIILVVADYQKSIIIFKKKRIKMADKCST